MFKLKCVYNNQLFIEKSCLFIESLLHRFNEVIVVCIMTRFFSFKKK